MQENREIVTIQDKIEMPKDWRGFPESEDKLFLAEVAKDLENLLIERDALMAQIRGECYHCKNLQKCMHEIRCGKETMRDCASNNRANWEWCVPITN